MTASNTRDDIQCLRALSVAAVVIFHYWPRLLPGGYVGVDVFFVISGFLITAHLRREVDRTGSIDLLAFWARRIRRLLPAALLVLAVTVAAIVIFVPKIEWPDPLRQAAAAAAYCINWLLAFQATDYFGRDSAPSAVQHYWSLSVEEQFYLVWPILLLGAGKALGRAKATLTAVIAAIFFVSLAWSVWSTPREPQWAYFSTFTHAWEFALGALASYSTVRFGRDARLAFYAAGTALIIWSCFAMSGASIFPGWIALIPAAGGAAILIAGYGSEGEQIAVLTPATVIGDLSYSIYLWHWPLLIVGQFVFADISPVALVVATVALAAVTKVAVEDPVRQKNRSKLATYAAAAIASATVCAGSLALAHPDLRASDDLVARIAGGGIPCIGAFAVDAACPNQHRLNLNLLSTDVDAHWLDRPDGAIGGLPTISYGDAASKINIALVGDSHAFHYLPALLEVVRRNKWHLTVIWLMDCSPSAPTWTSPFPGDMKKTCQAWRRSLLVTLPKQGKFDLIITSSVSQRIAWAGDKTIYNEAVEAFRQMWAAWRAAGLRVLVVPDDPGPTRGFGELSQCVLKNRRAADPCTFPRADVVDPDVMVDAAKADHVPMLDLTDVYCDPKTCHAVIGGLNAYKIGFHIAPLFAVTLAPRFEAAIRSAITQSKSNRSPS